MEVITERLARLWNDDKRVEVMRLAVQLGKMSGDPPPALADLQSSEAALLHYPATFFQLTDAIGYFGSLVHGRLGKRERERDSVVVVGCGGCRAAPASTCN